MKICTAVALLLALPSLLRAEETFVSIQRVSGNQIAVVIEAEGEDGGDNIPEPGIARGRRGARGGGQTTIITVPAGVKITSAMRERRTLEFRVGAELAGGLEHRVFQEMQTPLSARIVTDGNRITEINVVIPETDINQSGTTASGEAVIAVRPRRPPSKRPSAIGGAR